MRCAVLASGSGTILDAMVDAGVPVGLVVLDRPCGAADVAARHGLAVRLVRRETFGPDFDRDAYTAALAGVLVDAGIELVVMAGFGTVLGDPLYERFGGRVLNTHPSLLPAFPGWHAVPDAMAYGVKVTGCTVHVAVREVDAGPILAQEAVPVFDHDTVDTLHERIKIVERRLYPSTVLEVVQGRTVLPGCRAAATAVPAAGAGETVLPGDASSPARTPDPQETNR